MKFLPISVLSLICLAIGSDTATAQTQTLLEKGLMGSPPLNKQVEKFLEDIQTLKYRREQTDRRIQELELEREKIESELKAQIETRRLIRARRNRHL